MDHECSCSCTTGTCYSAYRKYAATRKRTVMSKMYWEEHVKNDPEKTRLARLYDEVE